MTQTKPLFIPWLYEQIQSGRYPGVGWINLEQTQFSIPWKHALRQDSNSEDVLIFKAWAQTSTAGDGRISGDPSVWKRNFRSALRAKGFKMISDNKNDNANPHKVYQFPTDPHSAGSEGSQETDASQELYIGKKEVFSSFQPQHLEQCFVELNLQEDPTQVNVVWNPEQISVVALAEQELYQATSPSSEAQFTTTSATGIVHFPIQETHGPFSLAGGAVGGLGQISPPEGATAVSHCAPAERTHEAAACHPDVEGAGGQVATHGATGTLETHFQVKVYYKGQMVVDQLVVNDAGFIVMYRRNMDDVSLMDSALPVVELPSPDFILDQKQAELTREILENLGGVELRRLDGVILGHRWGNSKVYWSLCKHEMTQTPRQLAKNTPEAIYLFKDYLSGLMEFIQRNGGPSPPYCLYFCLGEKWPDPKMKPWEKKLIMIEVVLTSLELLKKMAVERGASSLQSMELQVSLDQMMELC
ncbi:interferon regulatory factor 3 [Myxocyprinus asiaticus]|uniref:interferon regulatory factor 3 n=1 Tax=Myxocyprinus asiaticus TaxID=70543 RepID=UPI002221A614|nr:interferon regulatory factor 3 [Myxocyprinus asiaticus]